MQRTPPSAEIVRQFVVLNLIIIIAIILILSFSSNVIEASHKLPLKQHLEDSISMLEAWRNNKAPRLYFHLFGLDHI